MKKERNCQIQEIKIWSRAPKGCLTPTQIGPFDRWLQNQPQQKNVSF
jgi:hypothetical protein